MQRPVLAALLLSSLALPAQARTQISDPPPPPPIGEEEVWDLPGDAPPAPAPAPAPAPQAAPQAPSDEPYVGDEADDGAAAGPADREAWEAEQRYFSEQQETEAALEEAEAELQDAEARADAAQAEADAAIAASEARRAAAPARSGDEGHLVQQPFFSLDFSGAALGDEIRRAGDVAIGDFGMRFEGARWGFLARMGGFTSFERASFFNLTLEPTYALVATDNFRLRIRAGYAFSSTGSVSMGGLAVGSSMVLCLVGPLDLEADVTAVPFPYSRIDANVGLALNFGVVSFRAGWKTAHQDDRGHGAGTLESVRYSGGYGGMGLHF